MFESFWPPLYIDIWEHLTSVFVLGFVHLSISTFSSDPNDFKLVNAPLSPIDLRLLDLSEAWTTYSAMQPQMRFNFANMCRCCRRDCLTTYFGLFRGVAVFLSSGGLWGEPMVMPGSSGGRGRSARRWRAFLSGFFFPVIAEDSFRILVLKTEAISGTTKNNAQSNKVWIQGFCRSLIQFSTN